MVITMADDEILRAKKKAMSLLQHNDRTEWELRDRLKKAEFSDEATDEAIEYVRSFHYIDDERYAMRFAEIYHTSRSIQRIRQDLYKRHVDDAYIEAAIEALECGDDIALQKEIDKQRKGREELSYEESQKIMAKLYRKGFKLNDIRRLLSPFA